MHPTLSSAALRYMSRMNLAQPDDQDASKTSLAQAKSHQIPVNSGENLYARRLVSHSMAQLPVNEARSALIISPSINNPNAVDYLQYRSAYNAKTPSPNENQDPAARQWELHSGAQSLLSIPNLFSTTPTAIGNPSNSRFFGYTPTPTSSAFVPFSRRADQNENPGSSNVNTYFKVPSYNRPTIPGPSYQHKVPTILNFPAYRRSDTQAKINDKTFLVAKDASMETFESFNCDESEDLFGTKESNERLFESEFLTSSLDFQQDSNKFGESFSFVPPPPKKRKGTSLESNESSSYDMSSFSKNVNEYFNIPTEVLFNNSSMRFEESSEVVEIKKEKSADVIEILESSEDSIKRREESSDGDSFSNPETTMNSTYFDNIFDKKQKKKAPSQKQTEGSIEQPFRGFDPISASEPNINPFNKNIQSQINERAAYSDPVQAASASKLKSQRIIASQADDEAMDELFNSLSLLEEDMIDVDTSYIAKDKECLFNVAKRMKIDTKVNLDNFRELEDSIKYFERKRQEIEFNFEVGVVKDETVFEEDDEMENDGNFSFKFGDIQETLEDIEESFRNPPESFLTSTPQKSMEIKLERNSIAIHSLAFSIPSELTHISSSIPLEENYQFSLNSIMNITQKNLTPQEGRIDASDRFDFLRSLIREEDLLDSFAVPPEVDKEITERRRAVIMAQIEGVIVVILTKMANQKSVVLKIKKVKDFADCTMSDDILSQRETAISMKYISMTNIHQERTFTILVYLLCEIYKMLSKGTSCTRRELYYRDPSLMLNQNSVNRAIEDICILLNVLPWEISVLSSSKGLMAGDLQLTMADGKIIKCSSMAALVPQNPTEIIRVQSDAEYILVVEKDTVFTRLIQDKIFETINAKIILITGKGYPDINTRVLLKRLEKDLNIAIYIIVDADPHGIEIMCTYKFSSLHMIHNSEALAVKSIEWIGVYPSDIEPLDIAHTKLTAAELKKVNELLKRPYLNTKLLLELNNLKERKLKAEIEGLYEQSAEYFIKDFIPSKISGAGDPLMEILEKGGSQWYKQKQSDEASME